MALYALRKFFSFLFKYVNCSCAILNPFALLKQIFCYIMCDECTDAANREHIYYVAPFTISDSVYGSTFFLTTRAHGMYVLVGSFFLLVRLFRVLYYQVKEPVGLELAA